MILIVSEEVDFSTSEVIDWLMYFEQPFIRVNLSDSIVINNVIIDDNFVDFSFTVKRANSHLNDVDVKYSQVSGFWYRRGGLRHFYDKILIGDHFILNDFNNLLEREFSAITSFISWLLIQKHSIGSYEHNNIPKLKQLAIAKLCGLDIPTTRIITNKQELLEFSKQRDIIVKGVQEGAIISSDRKIAFGTGTNLFPAEQILGTEECFCPTLFQNKLEKLYEIRVFYLDRQCFSMAIFSQKNEKTKIDFRNYDYETPNRTVPYKLPSSIEQKICAFMDAMNMNCGSIDIVFTTERRYIFLEVNPIGQFQQVSLPCNYYLHKAIAVFLKNQNGENGFSTL